MRTEEQKILQEPLKVILGGVSCDVRVLNIKESSVWRKQVADLWAKIPKFTKVTSETPEQFATALQSLLVEMPDAVTDLFFQYAKDLNREEIEEVATDSEIAKGFDQVIEVAFPLARSLLGTMGKLSQ